MKKVGVDSWDLGCDLRKDSRWSNQNNQRIIVILSEAKYPNPANLPLNTSQCLQRRNGADFYKINYALAREVRVCYDIYISQ